MSFDSVYRKDIGLFNTRSCYLQIIVSSVLGRTIGFERPFLFTQNSKLMTKNLNLEKKQSIVTSTTTSAHETSILSWHTLAIILNALPLGICQCKTAQEAKMYIRVILLAFSAILLAGLEKGGLL